MEPFTNELRAMWSPINGSPGTILDKAGWPLAIIVILAFVVYVVVRRRRNKALDELKTYQAIFKRGNASLSSKAYGFERLIAMLRETIRESVVSRDGRIGFRVIEGTRFVLLCDASESIEVSANTETGMARVYWEMISALGRVPENVWIGDIDRATVQRMMQDMAVPKRTA